MYMKEKVGVLLVTKGETTLIHKDFTEACLLLIILCITMSYCLKIINKQ